MEPQRNQNFATSYYQQEQYEQNQKTLIYFAGVPKNMSKRELIDIFSRFGYVKDAWFMKEKHERRHQNSEELHRGCGTLEYLDPRDAQRAVDADHFIGNNEFFVRFSSTKEERIKVEMAAVHERRKIHVDGVPYGYPKGKKN